MGTCEDLGHPFPFISCSLWIFLWEYIWESFCMFQLVFWANCSTCWWILFIYLFIFFIRGYLIYRVMFQVFSKMIQLCIYMYLGFPLGSVVKESPYNEGDLSSIPGLGRYAQSDMTRLSRILSWRISWTEEPSRLQSIESQRVGHIWIKWACTGTNPYIYSFTNSFFHLCCYRISSWVAYGFVVCPCWLSML